MMIEKRVYLIGNAFVSYRARALIEFLASSSKYAYYYSDPRFYTPKSYRLYYRILFKGLRYIERASGLFNLLFSDLIFILPMSKPTVIEAILVRVLRKRVIGEFYISHYDTFVNDRNLVDKESKQAKLLKKIDQNIIDMCDEVIFLNASERAYYLALVDREQLEYKTTIIPLSSGSKNKARLPYANGYNDVVVLCWWGTFIPLHGLDKIIESAVYLKNAGINFKLYLFGTSDEKSKPYRSIIDSHGLNDAVIIDNEKNFSDNSLDDFLVDNCDIAFGNFGDSDKAKTVMVNKIVESASMGLPVISQETKALAEYFTESETIYFCDSNPQNIANKIIDVMQNKQQMLNLAENIYDLYNRRFSKEAYLKDILQVIDRVTED